MVNLDDFNPSTYTPQPGTVTFAGLAPGYTGLYQINVQVPSGLGAGDDVYLEVATDFADVNQVYCLPWRGASAGGEAEVSTMIRWHTIPQAAGRRSARTRCIPRPLGRMACSFRQLRGNLGLHDICQRRVQAHNRLLPLRRLTFLPQIQSA